MPSRTLSFSDRAHPVHLGLEPYLSILSLHIMKRLLLLAGALLVLAPYASAQTADGQWQFESFFPADGSVPTPQNHGLAVDAEGKVWIQAYYPFTGDSVSVDPLPEVPTGCSATTQMCRVTAIYVLNPDGTQADFSPLSIVTLPGGEQDTLGGGVIINSTGQTAWDYNSGRGLRAGPDGDVYAAIFNTIYKFDHEDGSVLDVLEPTILDARGMTAPGIDENGNLFVTGVFGGDPLAIYDANLDYVGNVVDEDTGFNRTVEVLPDGNTVFSFNYSSDVATVYQRPDEFSAWDSVAAAFRGMSIESAAIHPTTGNIWVSAGSANDPPAEPWQMDTWYEFDVEDVLDNEIPTPLDSIMWNNPVDPGTGTAFRPRAIAFSPDGNTVYLGSFNRSEPSVQKFVFVEGTSSEGGPESAVLSLDQNQPNPFTSETEIRFELKEPGNAQLRVFDTTGRQVAALVDSALPAGVHTATFSAQGLATGVYVYTLEVDGHHSSRRMLVVR